MKKDIIKLISFILATTFIMSGVIYFFVFNYKEEKRIKIEKEEKYFASINTAYEEFREKSTDIGKSIEEMNNYIIDYSEFYVEMPVKYGEAVEKVEFYTEELIKLENETKYLMDNCQDVEHNNVIVTRNCHSYVISFEKTVNAFINGIKFLNDKITDYNNWVDEEKKDFKKLELIVVEKYNNYVDYNKDGIYLGVNRG